MYVESANVASEATVPVVRHVSVPHLSLWQVGQAERAFHVRLHRLISHITMMAISSKMTSARKAYWALWFISNEIARKFLKMLFRKFVSFTSVLNGTVQKVSDGRPLASCEPRDRLCSTPLLLPLGSHQWTPHKAVLGSPLGLAITHKTDCAVVPIWSKIQRAVVHKALKLMVV